MFTVLNLVILISFIPKIYSYYDNSILHAPKEKPLGAWGRWEKCKSGEYARGVRLKSQGPDEADDFGISGIELFCGKAGDGPDIPTIRSSVAKEGNWAELPYFCEGYFEGFQLKIDTIADGDDYAGITNIRLFCSGGNGHFSPETESAFGIWTEPKICKKGQAICGLRTMIKKSKLYESRENGEDLVGINSLKMKCCDIAHQAYNCFPYDKWEIIFEVDNSLGYEPLKYKYTKSVGMEKKEGKKDTKTGSLIGMGEERYALQTRLRNINCRKKNDSVRCTNRAVPTTIGTSVPTPMDSVSTSTAVTIPTTPTTVTTPTTPTTVTMPTTVTTPTAVTMPTTAATEAPVDPDDDDNANQAGGGLKKQRRGKIFSNYLPSTTERPDDSQNSYLFLTQTLKISKETGFNWQMASSETWAPMRSTIVEVTVEPGHYVAFYQVVGICGNYFFRPEKFYQNGSFHDPEERRMSASPMEWKKLAKFSQVFRSFASMYQEGLRVIKTIGSVFGYKNPI